MAVTPLHINWLISKPSVTNQNGQNIQVVEFAHQQDEAIMSSWAHHFRNHYCLDEIIDTLRNGTGLSRKDYLLKLKFPDQTSKPGPSIISGDFAEILVADFMQFLLNYWVPRERYRNKTVRNESPKATDVVGFKVQNLNSPAVADELLIFEVKAKLSKATSKTRLQDAINHSQKDLIRIAEGLNALKQQLQNRNLYLDAKIVERFQNKVDNPYTEIFGAAAVIETNYLADAKIGESRANSPDQFLLVIYGADLMQLARDLYMRAANEA